MCGRREILGLFMREEREKKENDITNSIKWLYRNFLFLLNAIRTTNKYLI